MGSKSKNNKGANNKKDKPVYSTIPWSPEENDKLVNELLLGLSMDDIGINHNRSEKGIKKQINKRALIDFENGITIEDINLKYKSIFNQIEFQSVLDKRQKIKEKILKKKLTINRNKPVTISEFNQLKEDFENLKIEFDKLKNIINPSDCNPKESKDDKQEGDNIIEINL
jgi:hypothetical protein